MEHPAGYRTAGRRNRGPQKLGQAHVNGGGSGKVRAGSWQTDGAGQTGRRRAWRQDWPDVEMVSHRLPMLGLIGAVIGMVQMFAELKGIEAAADGLALLGPGAATALMSTAMGIAGSLWLDLNARVMA